MTVAHGVKLQPSLCRRAGLLGNPRVHLSVLADYTPSHEIISAALVHRESKLARNRKLGSRKGARGYCFPFDSAHMLRDIKQWFFESPTSAPRLLKYRSGHHEPPHLIRYYGDDGKQLLTASRDRSLRLTSVVRDSRSFEFSQGAFLSI